MHRIELDFIKDFDKTKKLKNTPIEGVELYSNLDIVINCIQNNLVKNITLSLDINDKRDILVSEEPLLFAKTKTFEPQEKKENFLLLVSENNPIFVEAMSSFELEDMNDEKFHILAQAIKNSPQIQIIQLNLQQRLSKAKENDLFCAIRDNASIRSMIVFGFMSQEFHDALKALPHLNLLPYGETTAKTVQELVAAQTKQILSLNNRRDQNENRSYMHLHYISMLLGVFGAVAIASAIMLANAALAALGAVSLSLSAYGFFKVNEDISRHAADENQVAQP